MAGSLRVPRTLSCRLLLLCFGDACRKSDASRIFTVALVVLRPLLRCPQQSHISSQDGGVTALMGKQIKGVLRIEPSAWGSLSEQG